MIMKEEDRLGNVIINTKNYFSQKLIDHCQIKQSSKSVRNYKKLIDIFSLKVLIDSNIKK